MTQELDSFKSKIGLVKGPVAQYFLLAIVITWAFWIPTLLIALVNDYFVPGAFIFRDIANTGFKDGLHILIFIINQVGVYGPLFAAIIVSWNSYGKSEVKNLLGKIKVWRVKPKWILIILLLPFIFAVIPLGMNLLMGGDISGAFNPEMSGLIIFLTLTYNIMTSGLEEPGWRGFAFPEMRKKDEAYRSALIVGFFWAVWHFPYVLYVSYLPIKPMGFPPAAIIGMEIYTLFGFTATILAGSIIFSWIYANTESLLILILFHAFQNVFPIFVMGQVVDMGPGTLIVALFSWLVVSLITKYYGRETMTGLTEEEKAANEAKRKNK
ncbi:MAG: CPBP family glutamic-type intramembrane protease [Promethearchaeota archaeon]|jgi:membrane protease YdiL (CAAX protease family)